MIIINLLPEEYRPIKRTPLPYILSGLLLILALAGIAWTFVGAQSEINELRTRLASEQQALAALQPIVEEANELARQKLGLKTKIEVINDILNDRIIWSQELNRLSELTPENIWYSDIAELSENFNEKVVQVDPETNEVVINPRTGQPEMKTERRVRRVLQVSGYGVNNEEGISEINPLMQNTANDPEFSSRFTLLGPQLEDTEFNGYPVRGFTLRYLINPGPEGGTE